LRWRTQLPRRKAAAAWICERLCRSVCGALRIGGSALPNTFSVTLVNAGTCYVTVSEQLLRRGKFNGAYCMSLESSQGAAQLLQAR
jgi:hypothetical protein